MTLLRLFSDKEEKNKTSNLGKAAGVLGGANLALGITDLYRSNKKSKALTENEKEVLSNLKKKSKGVNILDTENPIEASTAHQKLNKKLVEKGDKIKDISSPTIKLGKSRQTPEALAHELGHAHYMKKSGKSLGKAVNHPYVYSTAQKLSKTGGALVGLGTGINAAKKKHDTGEEESKASKYSGGIVAGASKVPVLIAEGKASKKGYELLKKSGANQKTLKSAKHGLLLAGGTYLAGAGINVAKAQLSHEAGKWIGKKYYERKDKEKGDDSTKK